VKKVAEPICREEQRLSWGFFHQPAPVLIKTRTHAYRYGFDRNLQVSDLGKLYIDEELDIYFELQYRSGHC